MKFIQGNPVAWEEFSRSTSLPHDEFLNPTKFSFLKQRYFDSSRRGIFHYSVFAHSVRGQEGITVTGIGELPDYYDFLLEGIPGDDSYIELPQSKPVIWQAGVFMHELGHNLGLRHAGNAHLPHNNPNFLSVMNYLFYSKGLWYNGQEGEIDYSRAILPPLVENDLNETVGLNGDSSSSNYGTRWYCPHPPPLNLISTYTKNANSPIDWNCNFAQGEIHIEADINRSNGSEVLQGHSDWANLVFTGGDIGQQSTLISIYHSDRFSSDGPLDEPPIDSDANHASPYWMNLTGPGDVMAATGTAVTYSFFVTNVGLNSDTYTINVSSSSGWVDTSSIPSSINLAPGESREILVGITIPSSAALGSSNEIRLVATSQGSPQIFDVSYTRTVVSKAVYLPLIRK
jgi:hypothetical protein